ENGKPTGNEDGTFYRSDKFEYRVKGIYLLRNDPQNPCYIESIEPSPNNSPYLSIEQCYEYFSNTSICKRGKVSIASNTPYSEHNLYAKATYKSPYYLHWTKYYYCWSNAGGQGCENEAPKVESGYYTNYYEIKLATAYVVQYNPVFRVYPYLAIADPNTWSYEKTVMLAIHYLGNKDHNGNINPAKRVLINKLIDKEYAYEVLKGYGLPIVDPESVKQDLNLDMRFRVVANDQYNCLSSSYIAIDSNNDTYTDELLLLQEGYYAISLHYIGGEDMQDIMLDLMNNQLADSTLQQEYYTARYTIAGEDTAQQDKQLFDFQYVYPARSFYATVVVKSVRENANGSLDPLPVYRIKITFEDYQGSLPLLGYLYAKYQYDILKRYGEEDQQLAYLPLCLEDAQQAYQQTEYVYYNTAQGVAWIRFTSLLIGEKAKQALEVNDLLDIPLQYALQAPTPYTAKIEIQPYPNSMSKTNTYMLPAFQQYQQYIYYANNGFYIWNDRYVHRYGDKLLVEPARYFRINELYISNDQGVQQVDPNLCRIGCTLYAGYGNVNLVARDEWFGTALAGYNAITVEPPRQEDPYIGWTMLAVTVLVSFFLIAYLKYLRREVNKL
ncbi:MAG: hypothetical protein QXI43_06110, partial [Candidatus Nitrosocaldus sp.]